MRWFFLFSGACSTSLPAIDRPPEGAAPATAEVETPLPSDGRAECGEGEQVETPLVAQGAALSGVRSACDTLRIPVAGAAGSTLRVTLTLWDADEPAQLSVLAPDGTPTTESTMMGSGASAVFTLHHTGEALVSIAPGSAAQDHAYGVALSCTMGCDQQYTRYPLVLAHGAAPAEVLGVDYFWGVADALREQGYRVYRPQVDAFAPPEVRAEQLAAFLDAASDAGEARRFNLIAHSQAGLDARYLVSSLGYGGQIASVTTIATPHRGTVVADAAAGLLEGLPLDGWLVEQAASTLTGLLGAGPAQAVGAIEGLTTTHAALFNQANPDDPRVAYASWSGRTCGVLEPGCQLAHAGEIVHPLLGPTYTLISLLEGPNDGMVGMRSSMWGQHLGSVPADHFDQIGQIAGSTSYDHIGFFLGEADRLATTGY